MDAVRPGLQHRFELRHRQSEAGGGVGVGDENGAVQVKIILRGKAQILSQRNLDPGDAVDLGKHRVKPVRDIRKERWADLVTVSHEREVQQFVRTVAHQNLIRAHAVVFGQGLGHQAAFGVGIELKPARFRLHRP